MQPMHLFLIAAFIIGIVLWVLEDFACGKAHNSQDDFNENEGEDRLNEHEDWM
jgi:hypothetical protein